MMSAERESMYWKTDKSWYTVDIENNRYVLTELAPEEAKKNFEMWKELNGIK